MPAPGPTAPFRFTGALLGEGRDEKFFFDALLRHLGRTDIQVEDYGGKSALRTALTGLAARPGFRGLTSLAVTRDADTDAGAAFQSVQSSLANAGLPVPSVPAQFTAGPLRVGVFILPDNVPPGMLEDLCLDAVQADGALPCVDDFFRCVARQAGRQPTTPNVAKARLHAWLASHPEPDRRLGEAAQAGVWPWGDAALAPLRQFLQAL